MPSIGERFRSGWNAFLGRDPTVNQGYGGSSSRPDRTRLSTTSARSILTSIYNRIAVDVASIDIRHVRLDERNYYEETIDDELNNVLTRSANLDQTGRQLIQDAVISMFDEGCVALLPTLTSKDPNDTESFKIWKIRTAKIVSWYPQHVRLRAYREETGRQEEIVVRKDWVAIVENPFYSIMNEPNSTLQRLLRTLAQLDRVNNDGSAGKLDLIVQVPYQIKSQAKREYAKLRKAEIEEQLSGGSQLGIAYIDGTEHVIQLNRPLENNLWTQASDLTVQLYNQLGLSQSIFDGTADEKTILNYYDRTISPILRALTEEMERKFLSATAISQRQGIRFFRDPFTLAPVKEFAELADKLTRNEIMTSNEIRAEIGLAPSDDPRANMLLNKNLNHENEGDLSTRSLQNDENE